MKIVILAGRDLSTAMMLPILLKELKSSFWQPTVCFVNHTVPQRASTQNKPAALTWFHYCERSLLGEAFQLLDQYPVVADAALLSPVGLSQQFCIDVREVNQVNDASFIHELKAGEYTGALSVRCLQILRPAFIDSFSQSEGRFVWNLHSGALPECRGAMPLFWTMAKQYPNATLSLHEIVKGIDEGKVVDTLSLSLKPNESLLALSCRSARYGALLISDALEKQRLGLMQTRPQPSGFQQYFSYPKTDDISHFESLGMKMLPSERELVDFMVKKTCVQDTPLSKTLRKHLDESLESHKKKLMGQFSDKDGAQTKRFFSPRGPDSSDLTVMPEPSMLRP